MSDFKHKLAEILDARIRQGREGIDLNRNKKGKDADIVYRNYSMSDGVINLGCKIAETKDLSPHEWVNWMADADISIGRDEVKVYHRTKFFCDQANSRLGKLMAEYFNLPVTFVPTPAIEQGVA